MKSWSSQRLLLLFAVPAICATAAIAQDTPSAPVPNAPVSEEKKAADEKIASLKTQKEILDAEKGVVDAEKALNDSRGAEASSALGTLSTYKGATGTVTVAEPNRAIMEVSLLSAIALREASGTLAARICGLTAGPAIAACASTGSIDMTEGVQPVALPPLPARGTQALPEDWEGLCRTLEETINPEPVAGGSVAPIIIVSADAKALVDLAEIFDVRSAAMGRELCRTLRAADEAERTSPALPGPAAATREEAGGSLAAFGTIANVAANLYRSSYNVYAVDLTEDQLMLVRELAASLRAHRVRNPIYAPELFPVSPYTSGNPAMRRVEILDALRSEAANVTRRHQRIALAIERAIPNAGVRTQELTAAKEAHSAVEVRLTAAIKAYDDLMTAITSPQGTSPPTMSAILRQAHTVELLRGGALLLVSKVHVMGGTAYTQENFFASLFDMPYHTSGGVLVSYSAHDGQTGQVYDAATVPVAGGFVRPTRLREHLRRSQAPPPPRRNR